MPYEHQHINAYIKYFNGSPVLSPQHQAVQTVRLAPAGAISKLALSVGKAVARKANLWHTHAAEVRTAINGSVCLDTNMGNGPRNYAVIVDGLLTVQKL